VSYDPEHARRARLDRAQAPAAYDKWFQSQVQAALDDPRPSIPHEEISARWPKKRVELLKKVKAA
jgi:hypothetical protein